MKTVAIISEYNPFHNGHAFQIKKIREEFGSDTRIIAVMSGNYTQRGEVAILDKGLRAKCAVLAGVNLVLELPFPYSTSSAEFFALAAVKILNKLGVVDYLSFGSECGDIKSLIAIAEYMLTKDFKNKLADLTNDEKYQSLGFPSICEHVIKDKKILENIPKLTPNNILAIEYIKALKTTKSNIMPHTIRRCGADYNSELIVEGSIQSATALRGLLIENVNSAVNYIPEITKNVVLEAFNNGTAPCQINALDKVVISNLRLQSTPCEDITEFKGGLYNRLRAMSFKTNDIQTLVKLTTTKKYTAARVRRCMLYSLFGVTSSDLKSEPLYTQLLALDDVGRALLRAFDKGSGLTVMTKPSKYGSISDEAIRKKEMSDRADSIYQLTKPTFFDGNLSLKFTPYVKKGV